MKSGIEETQLIERLAKLPREIAPRRDPWAGIDQRIQEIPMEHPAPVGKRVPVPFIGAMAAMILVTFTAGWLLGQRGMQPEEAITADGQGTTLASDAPASGSLAVESLLTSSEAEYGAAFREFLPIAEARPDLPYRTVFEIEKGWAILKATEDSIQEALATNPSDEFLVNRLLDLRTRQLELLRQLAELDQDNRRTSI